MTDGCGLDGYTISSACEPNGSGELKRERENNDIHKSLDEFEIRPDPIRDHRVSCS